ncbi:MAG: tetratricopeptide repeat protein [Anaerolineales bacterium]|nr:MAG: tetratricopeptide repeat protein [Anaerolineales bacterium]
MTYYEDLSRDYIDSIQKGQIRPFIERLNKILSENPFDISGWLFIARAYEANGDIENAKYSYEHLLRIISEGHEDISSVTKEILKFANRYNAKNLEEKIIASVIKLQNKGSNAQIANRNISTNRISTEEIEYLSSYLVRQKNLNPIHDENKKTAQTSNTQIKKQKMESGVIEKKSSHNSLDNRKDIMAEVGKAFQANELEKALNLLKKANELGEDSYQFYLMIAQTLQRLKRTGEAQQFLDIGIPKTNGEQKLALINLKAQMFSSQKDWENAIKQYEKILKEEKRPAVKRFSNLQLAQIYRRLGNIEKAKDILQKILKEHPQDQVTLKILSTIYGTTPAPGATSDDPPLSDTSELQVDDTDEGIALISPMLRRDIEMAEFRDEMILRKGGNPDVEDADRLLNKAIQTKGSEFGERYPEFLEAAKAYNDLPDGTYYDLEKFYSALARYAMLKGGALVSELRRRIFSNQINTIELGRLKDSATSYYLESLSLQVRIDIKMALVPLTNLLRAQAAYTLISIQETVPIDLFERNFSDLFRFCNEHPNDKVTKMAYDSVVALGAASGYVWNRLNVVKGGPSILGWILDTKRKRTRPYQIISQIIGQPINPQKRPRDVLQQAFLARRAMTQELLSFFNGQEQTLLTPENLRSINLQWSLIPHQGILSETDKEILNGVIAILAILTPYQTRSPEERTGILFTARTNIESILNIIKNNPTYWGRVGFEPLLLKWQTSLRNIEQKRISDIQPKLNVRLEPHVFYLHDNYIQSSIVIGNEGRGTAEGAKIRLRLTTYDTKQVLKEEEINVSDEIPAGGQYYKELQINTSELISGLNKPYQLKFQIAPILQQNTLDFEEHDFTLEVLTGANLSLEEIPWNEVEIPPEHLFKGREKFIEKLANHISSNDRNKTYILYGLTRTGKSSILNYLSKRIDLKNITINKKDYRIVTFEWNMATANAQSSAKDMWEYLLEQGVMNKLTKLENNGDLSNGDVPTLKHPNNTRFRDWNLILEHLKSKYIFPVFLIDEFSYYRSLVDSKRIDASFLAAIRQFAIEGKASFIFAGTFDLRKLVRDQAYGITGQLVNAIETKVSSIEREPAIELIQTLKPKLQFTHDAVDHILHLSNRIPYFIQLICRNCAIYAVSSKRSILGFPEVENVVQALTGSSITSSQVGIPAMAPGVFMNNMQTPTDPPEFSALISTICHLSPNTLYQRKVTYPEIQAFWDKNNVKFFQARLANAIKELLDREVLIESDDEGIPAYQIGVDIFRRWWSNEHKNIRLELDALIEEG